MPDSPDAHRASAIYQALRCYRSGDTDRAMPALRSLSEQRAPESAVYLALADLYRQSGQLELARDALTQGLTLSPEDATLRFQLGLTLEGLSPFDLLPAMSCYWQVLQHDPGHADANYAMGAALGRSGETAEAARHYELALRANPAHALASFNLGFIRAMQERYPEAEECYRRCAESIPHAYHAMAQCCHMRLHQCQWSDFEAVASTLRGLPAMLDSSPGFLGVVPPFSLLGVVDDPALIRRVTGSYLDYCARSGGSGGPLHRRTPGQRCERISVAMVSTDFRAHPTAYLVADWLECIDREQFDVHIIALTADDGSWLRHRIERCGHAFHSLSGRNDLQVAECIAGLEVDIAIDLNGLTTGARPDIFALRPAPIQVNYLAYPGTLDCNYFDYLVADHYLIPEQERAHYRESILYLPDSYQANDRYRQVTAARPERSDCRLPSDAFVFCSFNSNYKITPPVFELWMTLLRETPGSVLWLLESNRWAAANLQREAERRGVDPERLIFAPKRPIREHLARIPLADLSLDTFPCNAHTTASDALWMGLPLVTCSGRSFASRVAGSLLHAVGLGELVAGSLTEYASLALALAHDRRRLKELRRKLETGRDTLALFDTPRFTRHFEQGMLMMMERYNSGQAPTTLTVTDIPVTEPEEVIAPPPAVQSNGLSINLVLIRPGRRPEESSLAELAEALFESFRRMGFAVEIFENRFPAQGLNIVLGAQWLEPEEFEYVPPSSILYNVETVRDKTVWLSAERIDFLNAHEIWDCSLASITKLEDHGVCTLMLQVPLGYSPVLRRLAKPRAQDIDVLFFGTLNPRRQSILDALTARGLCVEILTDHYGAVRDDYIARAKVVVNIHQQPQDTIEQLRISYLLANGKAVVSEQGVASLWEDSVAPALSLSPYAELVDTCEALVHDDGRRLALEQQALTVFQSLDQTLYLRDALMAVGGESETPEPVADHAMKLNLTLAGPVREECLNVTINEHVAADLVLTNPGLSTLFDSTYHCERFGEIELRPGQFDEIYTDSVLTSVPDLTGTMTNCLTLLRNGGRLYIDVPYELSVSAWARPETRRAFNERSWVVYVEEPDALGWERARFELTELDVVFSALGSSMLNEGKDTETVLAQPRAVDRLQVVMTRVSRVATETSIARAA